MAKKYIDADKLRAEIDRRYQEYRAKMKTDDFTYYEGMADSLDLLEQFLDTLQVPSCETCTNDKGCVTCKDGELWEGKEQSSEDLEEAARLYAIPHYMKDIDVNYIEEYPYDSGLEAAFKAGAEWLKAKMPMPEDTVLFNKGVAEGRRLERQDMLKDAVEGYVNYYEDGGGKLMAEAQVGCPYHIGDKVKIVIVKED